jgi:hypothetical protein
MNTLRSVFAYLKGRLDERSTYMLILASLGSVAALDKPFNWIGFGVLLVAALVPDGTLTGPVK